MDCVELVELVTAYLEDALDEADRRRFEEHLAACEACRRYVDQMELVVARLGTPPSERLSDTTRTRLLQAFVEWNGEQPT